MKNANETVTDDLSQFGFIELKELGEILTLYGEEKLSKVGNDHFTHDGVKAYFNRDSGYVFLCDDDYNTLMLNDDTGMLDLWINLSYHGSEGFLSDLITDSLNNNVPIADMTELWNNYHEYFSDEEKVKFKEYLLKIGVVFDENDRIRESE